MKVLSLFDGMACARVALERCGFDVDKYYASEVDKYAIQVAKANYPDILHIGDVREVRGDLYQNIDLLCGGSPCQGFSFAGRQLNFDDPRSALFFEFVRLLRECKPKYFLLENVRMKKEYQDVITEHLGVEPIMINSSLVSAQNRVRLYWTNIPNIEQPQERGIVLADILERFDDFQEFEELPKWLHGNYNDKKRIDSVKSVEEKSSTLRATMWKGHTEGYVSKPVQVGSASDINGHDILKRIYSPDGKSPTLTTMQGGNTQPKVAINNIHYRRLTPLECERLQTLPDNYTECVSNSQRYKMIGNGWTVDVIAWILKNLD